MNLTSNLITKKDVYTEARISNLDFIQNHWKWLEVAEFEKPFQRVALKNDIVWKV